MSRAILCNVTHRFGHQFDPELVTQEDIKRCPSLEGVAPVHAIALAPPSIATIIQFLPYRSDRRYTWLYVRPQLVDLSAPDRRSGNWFHMDVDAVGRCVAPDWDDDFQAMAVAFGDVAETEFISEPFHIEVDDKPKSADYVRYAYINEGKACSDHRVRPWQTHAPNPGQVAHYTIRDFHRAGPIRKSGWRLIVLAFQTNAPPQEKWP